MKSVVTRAPLDRLEWKMFVVDTERPLRVAPGFHDLEIKR
jgi:hypothetical protein